MATKIDRELIRHSNLRTIAGRKGLTMMKRGESWWVLRDNEIIAGGNRGVSLDEAERLVRRGGLAQLEAAMAG